MEKQDLMLVYGCFDFRKRFRIDVCEIDVKYIRTNRDGSWLNLNPLLARSSKLRLNSATASPIDPSTADNAPTTAGAKAILMAPQHMIHDRIRRSTDLSREYLARNCSGDRPHRMHAEHDDVGGRYDRLGLRGKTDVSGDRAA
jgi:hypothetical protein